MSSGLPDHPDRDFSDRGTVTALLGLCKLAPQACSTMKSQRLSTWLRGDLPPLPPWRERATSLVSLPARNLAASVRATRGPELLGHSLGACRLRGHRPVTGNRSRPGAAARVRSGLIGVGLVRCGLGRATCRCAKSTPTARIVSRLIWHCRRRARSWHHDFRMRRRR